MMFLDPIKFIQIEIRVEEKFKPPIIFGGKDRNGILNNAALRFSPFSSSDESLFDGIPTSKPAHNSASFILPQSGNVRAVVCAWYLATEIKQDIGTYSIFCLRQSQNLLTIKLNHLSICCCQNGQRGIG